MPCDQEDPIYKIYKHQYFGYHPTCWRQFPTGWGCPSPERARQGEIVQGDSARSAVSRGARPAPGEAEEGMEGQPGVTRPTMPRLPGGARSPFETVDRPAGTPRDSATGAKAPLPRRRAIRSSWTTAIRLRRREPGHGASGRAGGRQQRPGTFRAGRSAGLDSRGARSSQNEESDEPNDRDETARCSHSRA